MSLARNVLGQVTGDVRLKWLTPTLHRTIAMNLDASATIDGSMGRSESRRFCFAGPFAE